MSESRVMVVLSGGLDSTTLAHHLQAQGWKVAAISFDYGQKHGARELEFARMQSEAMGWDHAIIDMKNIGYMLSSSLIDDMKPVPEGHYAADNMKSTVVPNRNAIMMSIATGVAVSNGIPYIATAVHSGDHPIYPDCRGDFIVTLSEAFRLGNDGFMGIQAPFVNWNKNQIAQRAVDLDIDIEVTWSCYKGGLKHCGKCGTCVERMEALWSTDKYPHMTERQRVQALFPPRLYEDNLFWQKALQESGR